MKPLLLVDGYNVIGAWDVPKKEHLSIDEARERLVHLIADYAGYSGEEVIVVFDGHYTDRMVRSHQAMHGVEVVFTKHAESADNYIEAQCAAAPKWRQVRVATSDSIEQTVTMGRGAVRISSREFLMELTQTRSVGRVRMQSEKVSRGDIFSRLPPHQREIFERMRRGLDEEDEKPGRAAAKKAAAQASPKGKPVSKDKSPKAAPAKSPAHRRKG
ncbi:MAG: NYN domain-containing protein [Clostridia bacterium]|nr:NYN domain-containing protein [Clostridia bacterium]